MIKHSIAAMIIVAAATSAIAETKMDEKQRISYTLGIDIARNMQRQQIEIDTEAFQQGLKDGLGNAKTALSDDEMHQAKQALQAQMRARAQAEQDAKAEKNITAGKAFIKQYSEGEGVNALDSGILYKVLTKGNGASPTIDDTIVAHYQGKLVDGTEFDSSIKRGEPATFPLKNVIQGWQQILPMMKVGSKWQVVIPPQMAYGDRGAGNAIGPGSTLVFEIELIEIKNPS